jgi:PAS domain-containing protein
MLARAPDNVSAIFEFARILPEATLLLSGEGEVLAANPPASTMLSLSNQQLRGKSLRDLTINHPEETEQHLRAWSNTRALMPGSLCFISAGGQVIDCRCDGAVIRPRAENVTAIIFLRCVPDAVSNDGWSALNGEAEDLRSEHRRVK